VNDVMTGMWKEAVVTCCMVLTLYFFEELKSFKSTYQAPIRHFDLDHPITKEVCQQLDCDILCALVALSVC
jgi:hypothetical protein